MNTKEFHASMARWKRILHSKNRDMPMQDVEDALGCALEKCIMTLEPEHCLDESRMAWIFVAAEHELANMRKKEQRFIFPDPVQWELRCARLVAFNDNEVEREDLHAFMSRYPARLETLLLLEEGYTAHEIAEKLRISDEAAQKRIERVREAVELWRNGSSTNS